MDLMKALEVCDSLSAPLVLANISDSAGYITPSLQYATKVCLDKTPGQLEFSINISELASNLGYQLPAGLKVAFRGTPIGKNSSGDPLIDWIADETLNLSVDGTTINRIKGTIRTSLIPSLSISTTNTCGKDRIAVATMRCHGTSTDQISVTVTKAILGIDQHDSVSMTEVAMSAQIGIDAAWKVKIHPRSEKICPPSLWTEGERVTFDAIPSGIPVGFVESYQWLIQGAQTSGASTGGQIELVLPAPSTLVEVTLIMTVAGIPAIDKLSFWPRSKASAEGTEEILDILCRIRGEILRAGIFDPLWDPLRSGSRRIRPADFERIGQLAIRIAKLGGG